MRAKYSPTASAAPQRASGGRRRIRFVTLSPTANTVYAPVATPASASGATDRVAGQYSEGITRWKTGRIQAETTTARKPAARK